MVVVLLTSMVLVAPLPHGPMCSGKLTNSFFMCTTAFIMLHTHNVAHGCWSDWGSWSPCKSDIKCSNFNMTRTRSRTCTMPEPGLGYQKDCDGSSTESMICSKESVASTDDNSLGCLLAVT